MWVPVSTLKGTLIEHVGFQPLTMDSRSNLTPEGFEPLTKSSRSNSPTNCTITAPHIALLMPFSKRDSSLLDAYPRVRWRVCGVGRVLCQRPCCGSIVGRSIGFGQRWGQLGLQVGDKSWEECTGIVQGAWRICYSPYGLKLFSGTGTAHMGNFLSPCPFRHGDLPYGYGDWCFCLPLSHGCAGMPPKILGKKPKFPALPLRVMGIHKSPYQNRNSLFPYGDWSDIATCSDMGITRDYRMVMRIHKSPYGNGVSPFPYGDCKDIKPHMETGITRDYHIETGTCTSSYGNGTWPLPYGDQKQTNPRIDTGITAP